MLKLIMALLTVGGAAGVTAYGVSQKKKKDDLTKKNDDLAKQNDDLAKQNDNLARQNDEFQQEKMKAEEIKRQKEMARKIIDDFDIDNIEDGYFIEDI